ncbi:hypothetical protein TWF481_002968 [Arthrobotrys musiformis]|uniref:Myb-like domain-containing protein n=1 Tax=Arthrobotrys musiformis TaxID=47236 RepID=A0AAV9VRZ0_9PEZI
MALMASYEKLPSPESEIPGPPNSSSWARLKCSPPSCERILGEQFGPHSQQTVQLEDEKLTENVIGRENQGQLDLSFILANVGHIDKAASSCLDYFLRGKVSKNDAITHTHTNDSGNILQMARPPTERRRSFHTCTQNAHITHNINPGNLDRNFNPVFRKINLTAFYIHILYSDAVMYDTLRGWDQMLARVDCYKHVEDTASFHFVKELRTHVYIRGMVMQHNRAQAKDSNSMDKILLDAFCVEDAPNSRYFKRTSTFMQKLEGSKLKGWAFERGEIKEIKKTFRKDLIDHISGLRGYIKDADGIQIADLATLQKDYPYQKLQSKCLDWLKEAFDHTTESSFSAKSPYELTAPLSPYMRTTKRTEGREISSDSLISPMQSSQTKARSRCNTPANFFTGSNTKFKIGAGWRERRERRIPLLPKKNHSNERRDAGTSIGFCHYDGTPTKLAPPRFVARPPADEERYPLLPEGTLSNRSDKEAKKDKKLQFDDALSNRIGGASVKGMRGFHTPRARKAWLESEVETLIEAIGEIGTRWSVIRDKYFLGTRSDVNLKDKARNMKFKYLKQVIPSSSMRNSN